MAWLPLPAGFPHPVINLSQFTCAVDQILLGFRNTEKNFPFLIPTEKNTENPGYHPDDEADDGGEREQKHVWPLTGRECDFASAAPASRYPVTVSQPKFR